MWNLWRMAWRRRHRPPAPGSLLAVIADPLARRRAVQVAHSLNVIAELPQYVEDTDFPIGLRVAAVDAFFIHLRLLIEFLIKKPDSRHPAIHRDDYASGFNLGSVDSALYQRLDTGFDFASQHVAHFSYKRLPAGESAGVDYVGAASLRDRAEDVFAAMRAFIQHMRTTGIACADDFEQWLSAAEARRAKPPARGSLGVLGKALLSFLRRVRPGHAGDGVRCRAAG